MPPGYTNNSQIPMTNNMQYNMNPPIAGQTPMMNQPMMNQQQNFYNQQGPINNQPMPGHQPEQWMAMPQGIPNCTVGLEYLTQVDQLLVKQKVEILEAITDIETANKYKVKNSL